MIRRASVLVLVLLNARASAAKGAEEAYAEARAAFYALKGDGQRRKLRHHWLNVVRKFEHVAEKHPKSERAPEALFTAAGMLSDLSRLSGSSEDLQAAVATYRALLERHPTHRLSDDGALYLARLYADRLGDADAAKRTVEAALAANGSGDRAKELKALLSSLTRARPNPAAAPKAPSENRLLLAIARAQKTTPPEPLAADPKPKEDGPPEQRRAEHSNPGEADGRPAEPAEPSPADAKTGELAGIEPPWVSLPKLEDIQERLRDVRVGEPKPPSPDPDVAERLRKLAQPRGGPTLAEQLSLKVKRVVIDAGHGGHDTGAIGRQGTKEKDVALAIARQVAAELSAKGLEVVLTRDGDTFVKLEDRVKLANEARGDLFLSIHCNAAPSRKLRGVETYTLNTASDRYSARLAAQENASSERSLSDLRFILADLATKANTEESTRLAARVQRGLVKSLSAKYPGIRDNGHKEALFLVLLGAKMPAVLIETAFLSNPEDEKLLASERFQKDAAKAIAESVREFLDDRLGLAKID